MERNALRVLVADNHDAIRECLVEILQQEFDVVGVVSNGYALIAVNLRLANGTYLEV